jgi:glycosyltransferase involved in cell wall biosynthesis
MKRIGPLKKILITVTVPETLYYFSDSIVAELKKNDFQIHAACSDSTWVTLHQVREKLDINVHVLPFSRAISPLKDFFAFIRLCLLLARMRPHVLFSLCAGKLFRIPLRIYMNRGIVYADKNKTVRAVFISLERFLNCCAHYVVVVSKSNLDYLIRHEICPSGKIVILGNGSSHGVDCSRFDPCRVTREERQRCKNLLGIASDAVVFGYVGRLVNDKGINELVEAWRIVLGRMTQCFLLIIGPKIEPRDRISKEVISFLSQSPTIRLVGSVNEPIPYYGIMDILVHPSYREGFPNVVLEAAAMKIPVITTNALGCVDSVIDGETGFIVPTRDSEGLSERMLQLAWQKELRVEMGKNGRLWVQRSFNPDAIASHLVRLMMSGTGVP